MICGCRVEMWIIAANTLCNDHGELLTLSENGRRLFLVTRRWQRASLNLTHCTTQDPRLGATITEMPRLFHNTDLSSGTAENHAVSFGLYDSFQKLEITVYKVLNMDIFSCTNTSLHFRRPLLIPRSCLEHLLWWIYALHFASKSWRLFTAIIKLGRARAFFKYNSDCICLKEESYIHLGWLEGE